MSKNDQNSQRPIAVIADDREAGSATVAALRGMDGVAVTIRRLELGDYEVDGHLVFERKTLPDLAASITDGRLFSQASRLAKSRRKGVFILEGSAAGLAGSGMSRESIQGALITLSLIYGLPVLRARNPEECARLMLYAARQVRRSAAGALLRHGRRPKGKRKLQLYILQGLPGIGPGRAKGLLAAFGTVEAVLAAPEEQLTAVPGVGPRTARRIRWAVSEPAARYPTETEKQ